MAVVLCSAVECSQLYHAPWIDQIRRTWFGRMALGDTFSWGDLAAYLVGIVGGVAGEWAACRLRLGRTGGPPGQDIVPQQTLRAGEER